MDVAQNHGKWMCTAPKHDQICSSKACVANIPEVGIPTFRHLSSMWLQFARRIDQSWWMQQNLNLKTTRLSFFEMFQSQFGVIIAFFIIDLVLGSSSVSGSHCNATNSFDGGHWVFLGIHMAIWCPEMSLYIDSIWASSKRSLSIACSIRWPLVCQNDLWRKLKAEFAKVNYFLAKVWRK